MLLSPLGKGRGPSFEQLELMELVGRGLSFEQTWKPFTQRWFMPSLVEIGQVVLEKKIFWIFSIFFLLSPLVKGCGPSFEQTWIPFTHCWFVPRPSGSEEDFLIFSKDFLHFCYYLLLELGVALHLNKVNPLHPNMLCVNFGWNWSSGSGKKIF